MCVTEALVVGSYVGELEVWVGGRFGPEVEFFAEFGEVLGLEVGCGDFGVDCVGNDECGEGADNDECAAQGRGKWEAQSI